MSSTDTDTRTCRHCGCTDEAACEGGCSWVTEDLCSACARERGVIPQEDFAVGVMVCPCGMRMVPILGPTTAAELGQMARPAIIGPGADTAAQVNAQAMLERLHASASHYSELGIAERYEPLQVEAWACPSCKRVIGLEAHTAAQGAAPSLEISE